MNSYAREISAEVLRSAREGPPVAVATIIVAPEGVAAPAVSGSKLLVRQDGSHLGDFGGGDFEAALIDDCQTALKEFPRQPIQAMYYRPEGARVHRLEAKGGADTFEVMVEIIEAPVTLIICGGGHIGLSLATIAAHVGFSVVVMDDREMYANPERFPMADKTMAGDFGEMLRDVHISSTTYIVMVSRGHRQDELALRAALGRGARYVGMIGSRRRVSTVLRHMAEQGVPMEELEAVYTPIGFDLGAETPEEIAVSIVAELIAVRRGGSGQPMRNTRPPILPGSLEPDDALELDQVTAFMAHVFVDVSNAGSLRKGQRGHSPWRDVMLICDAWLDDHPADELTLVADWGFHGYLRHNFPGDFPAYVRARSNRSVKLPRSGKKAAVIEAPAHTVADEYILSRADRAANREIIGNDRFRAYRDDYPWLQGFHVKRPVFHNGDVDFESVLLAPISERQIDEAEEADEEHRAARERSRRDRRRRGQRSGSSIRPFSGAGTPVTTAERRSDGRKRRDRAVRAHRHKRDGVLRRAAIVLVLACISVTSAYFLGLI